ncbi:MAG: hypothetical protein MI725_05045 [Pirellulales bacterium]|nr:hypothetical protein [Pirellulales bacterium]
MKKIPLAYRLFAALAILMIVSSVAAADPWADNIISYNAGTNPQAGFTISSSALGEPTRSSVAFGGFPITPFQSAADASEVVSLGEGGELIVSFDEPVVDDPANPFGIDLLVFGNSFFNLASFNNDGTDLATGTVAFDGGEISLSNDGINFFAVANVDADGKFPTLGFSDISIPFPASGTASVLTDFTKPVDPNFDVTGLNTAGVVAGYNGSGGGAGIDLATVGLSQITHVKITNPVGSGMTPEIDGFADVRAVPEPTSFALLAGLWWLSVCSRRR